MNASESSQAIQESTQRVHAHVRRREIKELIEQLGLYATPQAALARKYNVSNVTISNDIKTILSKIDIKDLEPARVNIYLGFTKCFSEVQRTLCTSVSAKQRLEAAIAYTRIVDSFSKFAESWGLKPVTPQLVTNDPAQLQVILREVFPEQQEEGEVNDGR